MGIVASELLSAGSARVYTVDFTRMSEAIFRREHDRTEQVMRRLSTSPDVVA